MIDQSDSASPWAIADPMLPKPMNATSILYLLIAGPQVVGAPPRALT